VNNHVFNPFLRVITDFEDLPARVTIIIITIIIIINYLPNGMILQAQGPLKGQPPKQGPN
jgi:hypothetical protein